MIFSEKKHCNRILFLLVMIVCLSSYPSLAWEGRTAQGPDNAGSQEYMSSNPTGEKVPWQSYVEMAGDKLGCYFTIEVLHSDDLNVPAESGQVMDNEEVSSVDALIAKVSREVKGIALLRNAKNPSIIQVMDERLKKIDDYALEKKLTISFSGTPDALIWAALQKRLPAVELGVTHSDAVTKVTVNAKDQIVRNILTDCVPLDVYRSILWRSETRNTAGGTRTVIEYFGPDVPEPGYHPGRFFRAIFWKDFAQTVAKKLDCYLTTEELVCWYTAPGVPIRFSSLGTKYLPRARLANAPESVEQFIDLLRQELDDVRVVRDAENPSVIHLVDEPLLKIRSYFMDRDVGLEYSGTLDGMLARLETMYPDLGLTTKLSQSVGLTTRVVEIVGDKVTLVRIAVKNKPVRHVLTEYLPLKRYQRILWESHTVQKDGKYMSWVVYSGPAPTPAKPARAPAEHKPQKQKEDAQRMRAVRNLASPMTVCSTTMAGLGLLRELSDAFARKKEGGVITSDLTTRWFPFAEFFAGRFGGVLHTSVPASERRVVESRMGGPLREVLLGSRNGAAASFLHRGVPWGY